jgi:hypothetical protein
MREREREEENNAIPVVHDKTCADDVRAAIDGSDHEGNLQQRRELVQVLHAGPRVHLTESVRGRTKSTGKASTWGKKLDGCKLF